MNNPKLSIITVNLNNALGLEKTIKSIVEQTYADYEYIIIDGGSTDGSVEVIKEYSDKITYWVSEQDRGIYNPMNKGIQKSTGEYLLFLNSGDYLCNYSVIEKMLSNKIEYDLIYGNVIIVDLNGKKRKEIGPGKSEIGFYSLFQKSICHQVSFINRKLFDKYGLYDEDLKIVSDWKFFIIALVLNNAIIEYKDINVTYYGLEGISATQKELLRSEREKVLKELIPNSILNEYKEFEFDWIRIKRIRKYKLTTILFRTAQIFLIRLSILIGFIKKVFHFGSL